MNLNAMVQEAQNAATEEDANVEAGLNVETDVTSAPEESVDRVMTLPNSETTEVGSVETTEAGEETPPVVEAVVEGNLTNMTEWCRKYLEDINENFKVISVRVKDVDADEDLIVTMPHPSGELTEAGTPKKKMRQFENSNAIPMINLPGEAAAFFSNTAFMIIHGTEITDVKIKYYGISARQVVFCQVINGMLIPYAIRKIKKNDKIVEMIEPPLGIAEKLATPAPMDNLIIRYKPLEKCQEGIVTLEDALKYFTDKSLTVVDINHLLHIDNVIINTLNA